jgi:hypothetical protein
MTKVLFHAGTQIFLISYYAQTGSDARLFSYTKAFLIWKKLV